MGLTALVSRWLLAALLVSWTTALAVVAFIGRAVTSILLPRPVPDQLAGCTPRQRQAALAWQLEATDDDPLLVLQPVPGAAAALAALPPFGPNPEATVRAALLAAGAVPAPRCPESCYQFATIGALHDVGWCALVVGC